MMTELMNQSVKSVRLNRFSKLTRLAPVGMSVLELSVPSGLNAADDDEQDREQREDAGPDGDDVAPADAR